MKKFIVIGILVFLVSMLVYLPASIASKLLPENIVANQFHGNLWNGSASSLSINNTNLGSVNWEVKPSCFIVLKLCADIKQNHPSASSSFMLKMRGLC